MVQESGAKKSGMRRTGGIRWDRWHRKVVIRSLQMMVMSRVLRRAEIDPPQCREDCRDIEMEKEASLSLPSVICNEQGWFTRFFHRWADSSFIHERHTT